MLHDQSQQLGVDFAQDAKGLGAGPVIDQRVLLPQFKEQFNLPARSQQGQDLLKAEHARWHIGHDERPLSHLHQSLIERLLVQAGLLAQTLLPLVGDRIGNPLDQQASSSDLSVGSDIHHHFPAPSHGRWQHREHIEATIRPPQRDPVFVAHQKIGLLPDHRAQPLQGPHHWPLDAPARFGASIDTTPAIAVRDQGHCSRRLLTSHYQDLDRRHGCKSKPQLP